MRRRMLLFNIRSNKEAIKLETKAAVFSKILKVEAFITLGAFEQYVVSAKKRFVLNVNFEAHSKVKNLSLQLSDHFFTPAHPLFQRFQLEMVILQCKTKYKKNKTK